MSSINEYRHHEWVERARHAFREASDYVTTNFTREWGESEKLANSEHPSDSKYHTTAYKFRSKLFRPKIQEAIERATALFATSLFSTADQVTILPIDSGSEQQQASAELLTALINIRLAKHCNWYKKATGAFQSALTYGHVVSKQTWRYTTEKQQLEVPALDETGNIIVDPITGKPVLKKQTQQVVVEDRPNIEIIPPESFFMSPAAAWDDPIQTSPYLIHRIPMYVWQVSQMMRTIDPKTEQPKWYQLPPEEIVAKGKDTNLSSDTVRRTREGVGRTDSHDTSSGIKYYELVYVHENFMRDENGIDYVFYTLGTHFALTPPKPLREVYPHGRPFVFGTIQVDAHNLYPKGLPQLLKGLQGQANSIANQRIDNVELAMNKRYLYKRGAGINPVELTISRPGGCVGVENLDDVRELLTQDVTQSSFQEQPLIDSDFDSLAGIFNAGSVQTNRNLNETVGGMSMLMNDASMMMEYRARNFSETWLEPVLRQLLKLEQEYEDDQIVLMLAGEEAQVFQRFGIDRVTDMMLRGEFSTSVNIGVGNTNPTVKVQKLVSAIQSVGQVAPEAMQMIKAPEVIAEIFGAIGHKDGKRFFNIEGDPKVEQLQQQIQQLQQQLQSTEQLLGLEREKLQNRLQIEQLKAQNDIQEEEIKAATDIEVAKIQADSKGYQ